MTWRFTHWEIFISAFRLSQGQPGDAGILVADQLGQALFFFFQAILGEDKNKARHGPGTGQSAG